MIAVKVVLDTNIVVSAQLNNLGLEFELYNMAISQHLILLASESILNEYLEVLTRAKFRFDKAKIETLISQVRENAILITPQLVVNASADEDDNRFLECAEAGQADYLITGNLRHFPETWKSTRIVNARTFHDLVISTLNK